MAQAIPVTRSKRCQKPLPSHRGTSSKRAGSLRRDRFLPIVVTQEAAPGPTEHCALPTYNSLGKARIGVLSPPGQGS